METLRQDFESALSILYKSISRLSSTMWGQSSLIESKLRSADTRENDNWKKETKAQIGYGEITKGSMTHLINLLQHIDMLMPETLGSAGEYRLVESSRFLDVGSGFGKPVFHVAMQVGCEAKGVEVVPARVEFTLDFLMNTIENKGNLVNHKLEKKGKRKNAGKKRKKPITNKQSASKILSKSDAIGTTAHTQAKAIINPEQTINFTNNWYERVTFERVDATKVKQYVNEKNKPYTHIYSYNKIMTKETMREICEILNRTEYKVLAWYFSEDKSRKYGLKDAILVHKMPMLSTGGEKFNVYILSLIHICRCRRRG
eukprot:TRINITY_DN5243_c0_g1_i3.p1 TRINITY_DN5243_c0_g1~~TRINITY_DN5243_c0_g1_i3.p1  ORF type:complete len:315 (+),score=64.25 TRINITY_DN5243_c0_g1_i3:84-1028(+)